MCMCVNRRPSWVMGVHAAIAVIRTLHFGNLGTMYHSVLKNADHRDVGMHAPNMMLLRI